MGINMEKKTYHHKDLKNELIEKGIELVNESGLNQLSLRKVAKACNVSHAAPYSHFKNKEELFEAMQLFITEQFSNMLEEVIAVYKDQPNFLLEFGKAYIRFFMEKPQYFTFLFQHGKNIQINLDIRDENEKNYKPFVIYKEQILNMLEYSNMSLNQKEDWMIALFGYIHGLASLATMENVHYAMGWENKLEDLISIFTVEF